MARRTGVAPKPLSQASRWGRSQQTIRLNRLGMILAWLAIVIIPRLLPLIPERIGTWPWKAVLWKSFGPFLLRPIPKPGAPPLLQWIYWIAAAVGLWMAWKLVEHWIAMRVQMVTPAPRTYLRLRVPADAQLGGQKDGVTLLSQIAALIPARNLRRGDPVPVVLRWTGRREQAAQQGVSLAGAPTLTTTIQRMLQGVAERAEATEQPDPLIAALFDPKKPDEQRVLCWADVRLQAGDDLPINIPGDRECPLLETLVPSLAPQADVIVSDVQVLISGHTAKTWRTRVLAQLESMKLDTGSQEQRMMKAKADGPAVEVTIRLLTVALSAQAGDVMIRTMAGALSRSAQGMGLAHQQLQCGPMQTLPARMGAPPAAGRFVRLGLWASVLLVGVLLAGLVAVRAPRPTVVWLVPLVPLAIPALVVRQRDRRSGRTTYQQQQHVLHSVPPIQNPQVVPLIADWFKRKPTILSVAEVATLWQPPASVLGSRVARVPSRWIDAPVSAYSDPTNADMIELGQGVRSDGSLAPIGIDYRDFRYIAHITAPMGRGKSEYLRVIFKQLMRANAPMMMLDCKGTDLVVNSIPLIPIDREPDVTILELGGSMITGEDMRPAMNLLSPTVAASLGLDASKLASTLIQIFSLLDPRFKDAPSIQNFANNAMLGLIEGDPAGTFQHMSRLFSDDAYREALCTRIKNPSVRDFWERRYPLMEASEVAPLKGFERRIDRMLSYPELAAMLVAPGCSIDLRRIMDNKGILLCGIKATEGPIAAIGTMFLLMQLQLAALSRSNVPEDRRPDFPVFIDEAQIVFKDNADLAEVMFSQFRAFRVGTVIVHQNMGQLPSQVMSTLSGNAQTRVILGAMQADAQQYASAYGQGLTADDFTGMERFHTQYMAVMNSPLFAAQMPKLVSPLDEDLPPPVYVNWQTVSAPARNDQERATDELIRYFGELARYDRDQAIKRLSSLPLHAYDAYCARTKMHRLAQWSFIVDNPGCIGADATLSHHKARDKQKEKRIRTLNALRNYIPRIETEALQYRLLFEVQQSEIRQAAKADEAAAAKKAAKKGGGAGGKPAAQMAAPVADMVIGIASDASPVPAIAPDQLPTLEDLLAGRGARRSADAAELFTFELGGLTDDTTVSA